jgi:very-short-patch-repair endonuclease
MTDVVSTAALIARVASCQRGLITREQALGAGLSRHALSRKLAEGSWSAVRRGVYRSCSVPETWHQRALATCLGRGAALAVSHQTAAYLHELLREPPARLDVVARYGTSAIGTAQLARVHRGELAPAHFVVVAGIPTTSVARTLADLAAGSSTKRLTELVDAALVRCGSAGRRQRLMRDLEELAGLGRRGVTKLVLALEPWSAMPAAAGLESRLEAATYRLLLDRGLPRPETQYRVVAGRYGVAFLDFAWPSRRVALEVDGLRFHSGRESFDNDRLRGNELLLAGWDILHTTATQVRRDPGGVVAAVKAALAKSRAPR